MKTSNLVIGIISIIIGSFLTYEALQVANAAVNLNVKGFHVFVGIIVGIFYIINGILYLILSQKENNLHVTIIFSCIAAFFFSFDGPKLFVDLPYLSPWAVFSAIYSAVLLYKEHTKKFCPFCQSEISKNDIICPSCGNTLYVSCSNCGTLVSIEQERCPFCLGKMQPQTKRYLENTPLLCPNCNQTVDSADSFCKNCGTKITTPTVALDDKKICPHCHVEVSVDDLFCHNCGKKVSDDTLVTSNAHTSTNLKCTHCDAVINENDIYCPNCGKHIDN